MSRLDRDILIWSAACLAFAALYHWPPPAMRYYPVDRVWSFAELAGPGMAWYGRTAWAALAALVAAGLTAGLTRRHRPPPAWLAPRVGLVALGVLVVLSVSIVVHEFARWGVLG